MSQQFTPLYVRGYAFFSPEYATIDDAFGDQKREPIEPKFLIVPGRLRRFTSRVTQMHLEVAGDALTRASEPPSGVVAVFSTAMGELSTAIDLLDGIFTEHATSAARFTQSVHNTPSGLFSIATGNTKPSTTVVTGPSTFATAILEAALLAQADTVLLTCADDAFPKVLRENVGPSLAVAIVLSRDKKNALAKLTLELRDSAASEPALPEHLAPNAAALALITVKSIEKKSRSSVELALSPLTSIVIQCEPMSSAVVT